MIPVKCPHCGVGLKVDEQKIPKGITSFKCPKCKHEISVAQLRDLQAARQASSDGSTELLQPLKKSEGKLIVLPDAHTPEQTFPLHEEGLYIVGRKAATSHADICIDTQDKAMSRNHLQLEVKKGAHGNPIHSLLDNRSKNRTRYNGRYLEEGEVIVLKNNDEIVIGDTVLRFCE
ncbi:MAG: FHA domain-containing protein [Tannerella sp.]|jgi:predicted Zn finger-like uncharacterized protein|nr:FHA domain-containing protein [Tannerella sp.]